MQIHDEAMNLARKDLEEAIDKADLIKQLEKIRTDDEMAALGWLVLKELKRKDTPETLRAGCGSSGGVNGCRVIPGFSE